MSRVVVGGSSGQRRPVTALLRSDGGRRIVDRQILTLREDPLNPLAPRDLLVLTALAGGPLHGYGIIKSVEAESGPLLDPGNLYRVLRRMRRDGWVEDAPDAESRAEVGADGSRRSYRLTARGRAVLRAEVERLDGLLTRVRPVLADGRAGRSS